MAKPGSMTALAEQAARIQTIGAARETLGYASRVLHDAYSGLDAIDVATLLQGGAFQAGVNKVFGITDELKSGLKDTIDIARAYVEGIYATYAAATPDLLEEGISTLNSTRVAFALQRALSALNNVIEAIEDPPVTSGEDFVAGIIEILDRVVTKVVEAAQSVVQGAVNSAATILGAFAVPIAVGVGVVVVFVAWRTGLFSKGTA